MDVWLWFFLFLIYFFYLFGWLRSFYECLADFLHRLHFNIKYLGIWNCLVYCVFRLRTATIHDVVRTLHDMNGVSKNWISDDFVSNLIIFFFRVIIFGILNVGGRAILHVVQCLLYLVFNGISVYVFLSLFSLTLDRILWKQRRKWWEKPRCQPQWMKLTTQTIIIGQ